MSNSSNKNSRDLHAIVKICVSGTETISL